MFILRSVFEGHSLKPMYCRTKKRQFRKTHANNSKKQSKDQQKHQKALKTMQITAKTVRKAARNTRILSPGRPSDKNITRHAPTQLRLARTHGTHDTHETKTKTKRSRSPGYGGRINRSNSLKPPIVKGLSLVGKNMVWVFNDDEVISELDVLRARRLRFFPE